MVESFAGWVTNHRWMVALLSLLVIAGLGAGAKNLYMSSDYRVFFSHDNPHLLAYEDLQETFTKNDNVMFLIAPQNQEVFTNSTLKLIEELTAEAYQIPLSIRVDSVSNFQHTYSVYIEEEDIDDLVVEDLVRDAEKMTNEEMAKAKQIALSESLIVKRLISTTGHVASINATISMPDPPADPSKMAAHTKALKVKVSEIASFSRSLVEKYEKAYPDVKIYLTGVSMMNQAFPEVAEKDFKTLIPAMFLVVLVVVGILLRSLSSIFATLTIIILAIGSAMGVAGWFGIVLTPPAMSAPTMILTLAVADCVHIIATFLQILRRGKDKREAIIESMRVNFQPVFLTSLTTAIGFLSMNFSDAPPFRDLGNIVSMGIVFAFILAVTLLPAMLMILPFKVPPEPEPPSPIIDEFANWVIAKKKGLLAFMVVITVGLISFIPANELNDEFVKYFSPNIKFRVASDFASDNLAGLYFIHYSLDSGREEGINDPEFLQKVDEFADWLRTQPEVEHAYTITDIIKRLNKNMHEDDESYLRLPDSENAVAQYLLLYEMSLRVGMDLNNQLDQMRQKTRVGVSVKNISTNELLALEQRSRDYMADHFPPVMQTQGTSATMMFSHIGERNIKTMLTGTAVALLLISVILMFALKSFKIGLISLVPNLVPPLVGFGIWGLVSGQVGLGLSVVAGMTLGIVVDDTVHFLSKYTRAMREKKMSPEDSVRYAFHNVGQALVVTTLVLMAGFFVLATSDFLINSNMGLLTGIVIGLALIADFLLLPTLLMKLGAEKR
jgi:uncharacterized protein